MYQLFSESAEVYKRYEKKTFWLNFFLGHSVCTSNMLLANTE